MAGRAENGEGPSRRSSSRGVPREPAVGHELSPPPSPGLQIDTDDAFLARLHRFQRIGWGLMLAILLAAGMGLFGGGPLSRTFVIEPESSVWVEYERFGRFRCPMTLRLYLGPGAGRDGVARLWLDSEYLNGFAVERVTPEPQSVETGAGRIIYSIALARSNRPGMLTLDLKPETVGPMTGRLGVEGEPGRGAGSVRFAQWIYP